MNDDPDPTTANHSVGAFPRTRWTWIAQANSNEDSALALSKLCEAYWYPVYGFVRRSGRSAQDAEDLTQGFFARMIEKGSLSQAEETRGRFRNYLLTALKHYLTDEHRKEVAEKRGGGQLPVSIDATQAERRYSTEPRTTMTPEDYFERQWAETLLQHVFESLREDYRARGKGTLYEALEPYVSWRESTTPQQEVADQLGIKVSTMRSEIFQLRRSYGDRLNQAIAATVETPAAIEDELKHLRVVFAKR